MQLLLSVLLFSVLQIQLATSLEKDTSLERDAQKDCNNMSYVSSYNETIPQRIKVLDALEAQSELNVHVSDP